MADLLQEAKQHAVSAALSPSAQQANPKQEEERQPRNATVSGFMGLQGLVVDVWVPLGGKGARAL